MKRLNGLSWGGFTIVNDMHLKLIYLEKKEAQLTELLIFKMEL